MQVELWLKLANLERYDQEGFLETSKAILNTIGSGI